MKAQIHELRTRIDGLAQLVKSLDGNSLMVVDVNKKASDWPIIDPSEHLKDCHKSILLAKAWLGKILEELGEETPYKNEGNRKTVEDIEATADKSNEPLFPPYDTIKDGIRGMTYIEKIDWLREEIQKVFKELSNVGFSFQDLAQNNKYTHLNVYQNSLNYLTEARFFLGFELQRIKEQSK